MNVQTFLQSIHTTARTGAAPTDYTGQMATNIREALNRVLFRFWNAHTWDYSVEEYTKTVSASTNTDITLDGSNVNAGQLLGMTISGKSGRIKPMSVQHYLDWWKEGTDNPDTPTQFVPRGLDSSGNLRFRLVPTPNEAITLVIDAKKKITAITAANITSNIDIPFFPEYTHYIPFWGVMGEICTMLNRADEGALWMRKFENEIQRLIANDQANKPDRAIVDRLPESYRRRTRIRGRGTSVL